MASSTNSIVKKPLYNTMDGITYPGFFSPKCFREALDYKPQAEDIFIVTYPKCGTTWMQNVALYIFRKGKELEDISQFKKHCPYIDMLGKEGIEKMPRPGAFKTHLPYDHLPYSPNSKYIFVSRNPKDCVLSFYHHTQSQPEFAFWNGKFDDFFEFFMNGEVEYNDYFDHLLSWYPHRKDQNVFFTTYEEMKKDIRSVIVTLAKFLGDEFISEIERDNAVFNNIVLYSSFDYMKKHLNDMGDSKKIKTASEQMAYEGLRHKAEFISKLNLPEELPELKFIRKGIVGDWKNVLTDEQNGRLNRKFNERLSGTDIPNWFSF
ncbi:sulfotransferase ssu-1 [Parasteatoda tepidariorum]|uniref:sulfotransferase ssu-1 n=1 Tax=Parasteatoda tepidariorum TaxID=114398 RepID=UPI001C721040|nr:sulfotransferase ssu-1 [Parasteatoda tepidariorum]